MKIIVIGAGLMGVTTAYWLSQQAHEVVVIERGAGPALETSFANGGMLTPGMSEPWNAPGVWRPLLRSLGRPEAALQIRMRALPGLASWGARFLRNSSPRAFRRNHHKNLRLALHSLEVMSALHERAPIDYGRSTRGSLSLFREQSSLERAAQEAGELAEVGLNFRRLSRTETVALEPALRPIQDRLSGSIHYLDDETGDAHRFCAGLAEHARRAGVQFCFDVEVQRIEVRSGRVTAVEGSHRRFVGDRYVVAAGAYSSSMLQKLGVKLPVRPAKGYSLTFDATSQPRLDRPVIDNQLHAVIVPLPGVVRAAGTAEFAGYDRTLNFDRIRNLQMLMKRILPQGVWDLTLGKPWCGLRPSSPDGVPIIGPTPIPNVWVNSGQGHLGWTLAAGSAQLLTDLMTGKRPGVDPADYSLTRFQVG